MDGPRITTNPAVMLGKPCVAGTRLTVQHVLEELVAAGSIDGVITGFPQLTREDVRAALLFAAHALGMPYVRRLKESDSEPVYPAGFFDLEFPADHAGIAP